MDYLLLQILLFLILAAVIGFFCGWITRGLGFESRLLASENQWRARHHVLQSENNRLQTELDATDQEKSESLLDNPNDIARSLPLPSNQEPSAPEQSVRKSSQLSESEPVLEHPLEKLRNEFNDIEKQAPDEQISEEIELFEKPELSGAPASLDQPEGKADDLKAIKGIGPKIESTLNGLGIYHFRQIADFTEDNISWVNEHLQFSGRIEREEWIAQAKVLDKNSGA